MRHFTYELKVSTIDNEPICSFRSFDVPNVLFNLVNDFNMRFGSPSFHYFCAPRAEYHPKFNDGKQYVYDQFMVDQTGKFPYARFVQTLKLEFFKSEYHFAENLF